MKLLGSITDGKDIVNKDYVDTAIENSQGIFIAVYTRTTYAELTAAIAANKVILLDMTANNNLFCMTYSTYTNGGNAILYAIFDYAGRPSLITATLTPSDHWTISNRFLQDELVSGTNIKTINNQSLLGSGNITIEAGTVDQTYDSASANAQSGTAVAEAVSGKLAATGENATEEFWIDNMYIDLFAQDKLYLASKDLWLSAPYPGGAVRIEDLQTPANSNDAANKGYVDGLTGALSTLTTTNKTNLVSAINEVYEKSGEPFRVKNWTGTFDIQIPTCTTDISNTQVPKMVFSISGEEGVNYQIVGMIAYEVFDSASGGNRLNVWPVCQFTGNGQKELSVRWMCGGTTAKNAKRINAWVLLKHR